MPSRRSEILGRLRLIGVYLFVAALVVVSRPTPLVFGVGLVFVLLGESVRIWAAGHLVKSVELIDSGPYARTQNPLYLGRLLILTGFCVMARNNYHLNWIALAAGYAIFFGYYFPRKLRVEGDRLRKLHGDSWETYRSGVPILFPSPRRYPGRPTRWSFRRMVSNQEPFVLAGILLVLAFFAWRMSGA